MKNWMVILNESLGLELFWVIGLMLLISGSSFAEQTVKSSSPEELQKEAFKMLNLLPSSSSKEKTQDLLQQVFDHYENLNVPKSVKKQAVLGKDRDVNIKETKPQELEEESQKNYGLSEVVRDQERDPFALTSRMRNLIPSQRASGENSTDSAYEFQRLSTGVKVPKLKLKGLIVKSEVDKAAVLDIQGLGSYVVREGDTLSIPDGSVNNVIKVTKIDRLSLMIEVGKLGEVIIVR